MQDWDAVTQCLLQQKDVLSGDNQLANRGATILCHLLLSTVKHAMQPASAGEQLVLHVFVCLSLFLSFKR